MSARAQNPFITDPFLPSVAPAIYADVPDMSMARVEDTYYMSSTTMHMSPGVPVMKSKDLVNWEMAAYACDTLADTDEMNLKNGKNDYGRGSWASCIRYHKGYYYVSTFSGTTNKTYIYRTRNIGKGKWERFVFEPSCHDHSIFFDDDGKTYIVWGNGKLMVAELKDDLSGLKEETVKVWIENASAPAGKDIMLGAEGSQLFKINGKYYLFNIVWPRGGMRTVVVHRADRIGGNCESRVVFQDKGIAQGGLIDTPDGRWFAYLFRDFGAVGRIPYMVPVRWEDGWPVLGDNGRLPDTIDLPASRGLIPGIVASDEFERRKGDAALPLVWQWNHNPDNSLWSVSARKGYLRLTTGSIAPDIQQAKNTLTQRTLGPVCSGIVAMDVSGMNDGDCAGLALLQKEYGWVGVKVENGNKRIVMQSAEGITGLDDVVPDQPAVYLKAVCDFTAMKDMACFYYSLDGERWTRIGSELHMRYTMPHFMGYRFGLFNYATKTAGGYADFDYFHISDTKQD
ncbi:MAG: glycoside hydrolase 43 family protein [Tannerella sp.]|nr:glycoside hydrolase 43 family protein [Tannerella sp.]